MISFIISEIIFSFLAIARSKNLLLNWNCYLIGEMDIIRNRRKKTAGLEGGPRRVVRSKVCVTKTINLGDRNIVR
jgi:hypothetical protein